MDELLDCLYNYLTEERLPRTPLPAGYAAQAGRKDLAFQRLTDTFSQEQKQLYFQYENEVNGLDALEFRHLFQAAFCLAKELYR
jgi:hypothetical protein